MKPYVSITSLIAESELEQDTKNAATKGGILERGIEFFFEAVEERLNSEVESIINGKPLSVEFFG